MKYNDRGTMRSYLKQQERYDLEKSDRAKRRELEREYKTFLSKFYKYVERDWWDSVSVENKKSLYSEWSHIKVVAKSQGHDTDFGEWVKMVRRDTKPNIVVYRNKILERLLDE